MPYKNSEDAKNYRQEYRQRPEVKEKQREYNQRPEVKEKQKEYNQVQKYKRRQKMGEERWYKKQIVDFNLSCMMDWCTINDGDYKTWTHSRNHEFLYFIHKQNQAYNDWLKTDKNNHPPI